MDDFSVVFDPMLDKERAEFITGGTGGGGGDSYVAGEGIAIAGQTIYTADVPQSAVSGLSDSFAAKQDVLTASFAGYRMSLDSGTMNFSRVANIVNVTGATVTLEPDTAYKVQATTQAVTLNANVPASGQWGLEGHIELFVAGTGYVVTGSNVVLANALEPDAVNNCTVRFHDGYAIISVEDHVAGYIVTANAASGAGSLAYGLATATNEYISVDASLNGQTLDLAGATTYAGEKHVVGNGYEETIISGGINCTSKTTLSNLAANGVVVSSGTLTLGDVFIPSGSTVAVSGGGLAIEKVTGNGGVFDLGGSNVVIGSGTTASASGCTFTGGSATSGGCIAQAWGAGSVGISGCLISGCSADSGGALFTTYNNVTLDSTEITGNNATTLGGAICHTYGNLYVNSCYIHDNGDAAGGFWIGAGNVYLSGTTITNQRVRMTQAGQFVSFAGSNHIGTGASVFGSGSVQIQNGAIVDLTGNSNDAPISPGGRIVISGGCTVINSAGASVSIAGGTYTKINNDGTTE